MHVISNSWVLANIMLSLPIASKNAAETWGHRGFCILLCPKFWVNDYKHINTHYWELMNSVGVMASHQCYSWWRWLSHTCWATVIRVITSLIVVLIFKVLFWSFLCKSHTCDKKHWRGLRTAAWYPAFDMSAFVLWSYFNCLVFSLNEKDDLLLRSSSWLLCQATDEAQT